MRSRLLALGCFSLCTVLLTAGPARAARPGLVQRIFGTKQERAANRVQRIEKRQVAVRVGEEIGIARQIDDVAARNTALAGVARAHMKEMSSAQVLTILGAIRSPEVQHATALAYLTEHGATLSQPEVNAVIGSVTTSYPAHIYTDAAALNQRYARAERAMFQIGFWSDADRDHPLVVKLRDEKKAVRAGFDRIGAVEAKAQAKAERLRNDLRARYLELRQGATP